MADAKTICPKCGGHIAYPKELAGEVVPCPHCNKHILLPKSKTAKALKATGALALATVCFASVFLWEHRAPHHAPPSVHTVETGTALPVHAAESTNSHAAVLQKDAIATGQLMSAVQYGGNVATVKLLLQNGADVNAADGRGWTALHYAAQAGNVQVAKLLLEKGAAVDVKTRFGTTSLAIAAWAGQTNAVGFLLENGADINSTNFWGETPLIEAAEQGTVPVIKLLLANGAEINAEDTGGQNALDKARARGATDMVQLLQQSGATASSGALRDEAMSNDLEALRESVAAFSNRWKKLQLAGAAGAVVPDISAFQVLNATAKVTEQNQQWWRFGYRLTVRNNGISTDGQWFEIQFLDAEGYVIDKATTEQTSINPGTTVIITGDTLIDLPGAARVTRLKALWKP